MKSEVESQAAFLRHVVATIAYRGGKSIRDAPAGYGDFQIAPESRTPVQILSHMGDVLSWAIGKVDSNRARSGFEAESWSAEVERFFSLLADLDSALAGVSQGEFPGLRLLQGPLADTLTHIGQLAMLRRLAGAPVRGENYFEAHIVAGDVGAGQAPPTHEFD
ncbi:MAG: hypothetical protein AAGF23_10070 [Acidobacteriota bacterium]